MRGGGRVNRPARHLKIPQTRAPHDAGSRGLGLGWVAAGLTSLVGWDFPLELQMGGERSVHGGWHKEALPLGFFGRQLGRQR